MSLIVPVRPREARAALTVQRFAARFDPIQAFESQPVPRKDPQE